jgi:hypothetical protein
VTAEGVRLDHAPVEALIRRSRDGETLSVELAIPRVAVTGRAGEVAQLDGVAAELTGTGLESASARRTLRVELEQLQVDRARPTLDQAPPLVAIPAVGIRAAEGVRVQLDQAIDAERMDLRLALVARWIDTGGERLGPADVAVVLEHLRTDVLRGLIDGVQTLRAGRVSQEMRGLAQALLIARLVSALAASEARIGLDPARIESPDGAAAIRLTLGLDPEVAGSRVGTARLMDWTALVRADGDLEIPTSLALRWLAQWIARSRGLESASDSAARREAQSLLDNWKRDRWVAIEDGRIVSSLRLGDGLLTINGKTLPLGE